MRGWRRFRRERRGVAALEFALAAPVILLMTMGLTDLSDAVVAWWQLSEAADAIALIATSYAATTTNTNVLSAQQAATAGTAIYALQPDLKTQGVFGVTISSVAFTATPAGCVANCTYAAHVAWSVSVQGSGTTRSCGLLARAADDASPSALSLPADAFTAAPILVVDVTYSFVPMFTTVFGGTTRMMASAYMSPRTGGFSQWVRYTGPDAAKVQCPGYVT